MELYSDAMVESAARKIVDAQVDSITTRTVLWLPSTTPVVEAIKATGAKVQVVYVGTPTSLEGMVPLGTLLNNISSGGTLADVLTPKDQIYAIRSSSTIAQASKALQVSSDPLLTIVDDSATIIGYVTRQDVTAALSPNVP